MKKLLPLLLLILIGCSSPEPEPINMNEMLIEKYYVYYTKDTNQPYSGPVFSLHENGQLKIEVTLKNGEFDGPYKEYYENGQLRSDETYKDGNMDGPYIRYYSNGIIDEQGSVKYVPPTPPGERSQTVRVGPHKSYYWNGQLNYEGTYTEGSSSVSWETPIGIWKYYYENGQLRLYDDNDNKT